MSDYITTVLLVAGIITAAVLVTVFFLIIPLRISLSFRSRGMVIQGDLTGSWFIFGLDIRFSGNDPRVSLKIGGVRLVTRQVTAFTDLKKYSPGERDAERFPVISLLKILKGPVLNAILDLIRHTRLDYVRGNARIGLDGPAATGMFYGLYRATGALLPLDRINFNLTPEFNEEVCEIDLETRFHIAFPIRMIVHAVRIVKHPAIRKVMKKSSRRSPQKVAG
ncbi:MAG TPA: DUF2953 domain-containing protein [Methanoregulaceae archaeon]|nr:DUF2953 domain-containing protein [Methanoregulaceae archaeon]